MRKLLLVIAAATTNAASPAPDLARFDEAVAARRFDEAATIFDRFAVARTPADGQPRPDALLDALMGRIYLLAGQPGAAATLLDALRLDALPPPLRATTALAKGAALEWRGRRSAALAAYSAALAVVSDAGEREQATLGVARLLMVSDPSAARQQLLALATGPPTGRRWHADYLLALASSLGGDGAAAARFADNAWSDSASAPPEALAPLHVATLRAGLAAARGDASAERAMLAASNGLSVKASGNLANRLPVCGDDGVTPADFVIMGIVKGSYDVRRLLPIAASRPAVVAPFYDRLAGAELIDSSLERPLAGTVVTLACRTAISASPADDTLDDDPLLGWFVERGLYPASASSDPTTEQTTAVRKRIDDLQARFGVASPLLIAPKSQLLRMLEVRARAGDPVLPGQLGDLRADIAAEMRRAGGPAWLADSFAYRSAYDQLVASGAEPAEKLAAVEQFLRERMATMPFAIARAYLATQISQFRGELPAPAARLVLALDKRRPSGLAVSERQAWALTVGRAQASLGDIAAKRKAFDAAGIARDLCVASDTDDPDMLEQHFSNDDYPPELTFGQQEGAAMFDFTVGTDGKPRTPRIVIGLPSGLFDALSIKGFETVRYTPAKRGGQPFACRGLMQNVVWRLEGTSEFTAPTMAPEDLGDIS